MESLTITITGEALKQLREIEGISSAEDTADVVLHALRVYAWMVRKKQEGFRISLTKQIFKGDRGMELYL
ncbi:MAG: hypothetical protein ACYCX4_07620 [Bacillota bacterium]